MNYVLILSYFRQNLNIRSMRIALAEGQVEKVAGGIDRL